MVSNKTGTLVNNASRSFARHLIKCISIISLLAFKANGRVFFALRFLFYVCQTSRGF